jgi:[ribosomal protein S18]-alanine N-acetyltransferase
MTLTYAIRPAKPADLDALLAIEQAAFNTDHLSRRQYRKHLVSATAAVLVAAGAGGILGKTVVFFRAGSDIARLYSIAVAQAARGQGLGLVLLHAAEKEARRRGCRRMRLEVSQVNPTAMQLYEREGYERIGEQRGYYENGEDAWRYQKVL